jgi:Ras family protein T1
MMFLFAKSGKFETLWKILRSFKYQDDLTLSTEFLTPSIPDYEAELDDVFELKPEPLQFLSDLFHRFDKDQDGALSLNDISRMFITTETATHPFGVLFPHNSDTTSSGAITLQGFLANWRYFIYILLTIILSLYSLLALDSYRECMKQLALLGYSKNLTEAFEIT